MSDADRLVRRTAAAQGDFHFFAPAAMEWFDSRLLEVVWTGPDAAFFVSSEKPFDELSRGWQVRIATFWRDTHGQERVVIDPIEGRQPTHEHALDILARAVGTPLVAPDQSSEGGHQHGHV